MLHESALHAAVQGKLGFLRFAYFARLAITLAGAWRIDVKPTKPVVPAITPRVASADSGAVEGSLVPVPLGIASECSPHGSVAVHPDQRLVYYSTSGGTQGFICAYEFDPDAQTLTSAPGSPFATGGESADAIAIDPSGTFLYSVASADGAVAAFSIDTSTGALTRIVGSPFPSAPNPLSMVVDPTGRFVYVATRADKTFASTISGYAIDPATGVLSPLPGSPFPAPESAAALAVDPLGRYLYLTANTALTAYAIDAATGALAPIGTPVVGQGRVAVDPAGRFVYVEASEYIAPRSVEGVRAYKVEANGALTAAGGFVGIGQNTLDVTVSRSGRFVYVVNRDEKADFSGFVHTIVALKRDEATGALTPIAEPPLPVEATSRLAAFNVLPSQSGWLAGEPMFYPLGVYGGYPPYTWSVASGSVPPGLAVDAKLGALRGTPTTPGTYDFVVQASDGRGGSATKAYHFAVAATSVPTTVVEYYHQALDHYFITWMPDEIAKLDAGTVIKGWARTGSTFPAYTTTQATTSPVCRYYIPPALGDSHFFGRGTVECDATGQKNPSFVLEDSTFMYMVMPSAGACPANTLDVYRVFSNRPDANHRYMTDKATRDQMVARGWLAEGDGPDLVVMCAPQP